MKKITYTLLAIGATVSLFTACVKDDPNSPGWEYFPDMYRSPSAETNGEFINSVTPDSMSNRLPAPGTIPRGFTPFPYENTAMGDSLASAFWKNPLPHNDSIEDQGKFLFERFCIYCHGPKGDGQGPLVASGKYTAQPPNYADLFSKGKLTDGHVYHVITYGKGNMGSHASQLSPEERWKVIEYVERLGRGGKSWSDWQKEMAAKAVAADSTAKPAAPKPNKP